VSNSRTLPALRRAAVVVPVIVAALLAVQGVSYAEDRANAAPGSRVVHEDEGGIVSVPANTGDTKQQWLAKYAPTRLKPGILTPDVTLLKSGGGGSGHLYSSGSASGPGGAFYASGDTDYKVTQNFWDIDIAFSNNYAYFYWSGQNPYNATTINGSMKWWVSGFVISPQLPAGAGFSVQGSSVTWERPVSNNWQMSMTRSAAVHISAQGYNTSYFTDQADFLLGSNWYWVQGN
jgi:hypothetical protein